MKRGISRYAPSLTLAMALVVTLAGCGERGAGGDLPVIDVAGALGTYRQVPMSEYIEEVEYIPLETGADCLVGRTNDIIVTDDRIIIGAFNECHMFTREGKFLSDVGRVGRGPGEWEHFFSMSADEENDLIYLGTYDKMFAYTMGGKYVRDFLKPIVRKDKMDRMYPIPANYAVHLRDNTFLGYTDNDLGQEPLNWVIFDDTGTTVKAFENHVKFDKESFSGIAFDPSIMASESTWVKEGVNDTLFTVSLKDGLTPRFVFDFGKYAYPLDKNITFGSGNESTSVFVYSQLMNLLVLDGNVFFALYVGQDTGIPKPVGNKLILPTGAEIDDGFRMFGLYDIMTGKTELLDRDTDTRRAGLVNDIDGGLSFWPKYYNHAENTLVQVLNAYEIKDVLTEEYFAAHPARDPAAHARLRELVRNLKYDDNPVIVIAKLKK